MRNKLFFLFLLNLSPIYSNLADEHEEWIRELHQKDQQIILKAEAREIIASSEKNKIRQEDVEWLKKQIKDNTLKPVDVSFLKNDQSSKCKNCFTGDFSKIFEEPKFLIFISFSVPDSIWCSLSKDLSKVGGSFVLIGLPNNSFSELSERILKLKERGVDAQIQIDPLAFKKYHISHVPAFVISDESKYDKVSGAVSVEYALNYLAEKGELDFTKMLRKKLGGAYE